MASTAPPVAGGSARELPPMDDGLESAASAATEGPSEPTRGPVSVGQVVGDLDRLRDELLRIAAVVLPSQEDRS